MSSRVISGIFDAKEPEFSHSIFDLERLSGRNSHDIRVLVDALHHFKDLSGKLDLNAEDTTARELYHALAVRSKKDSLVLAERLGIKESDTSFQAAEKCARYLEKRVSWRKFWNVKQSTIKKQLKSNPPKKVMKILGFRSIDSLIKREPVVQTLILSKIIEGPIWLKRYIDQASSMTNSDFNEEKITIKVIEPKRLYRLKKASINLNRIVFSSDESSDIVVAPASSRFEGDVLFYFDTIINHINGIINRSAFYKFKGLQPDFFKTLRNIREYGFKKSSSIKWPLRWSAVMYSIQYHGNQKLAQRLDLNIPAYDLFGLSTEKEMQQFGIWERGLVHSDKNGSIVSTHLSDSIINAINKNIFESSYNEFGKNRLYDELFSRYLVHDEVIDYIFREDTF
jgi:hypothetical protein